MKFGWAVLLLWAGLAVAGKSQGQGSASVYAEFNTSRFHNLVSDTYLNGATAGLVFDVLKGRGMMLSGDLQGRFLAGAGRQYSSASIGPRVSVPVRPFHLVPYGEFLLGYARFSGNAQDASFNTSAGNQTTDSEIQLNAGVSKQVSPHFAAMVEYSYSQFYAYGGQFNPKTFSAGAVYHFAKR